MMHIRMKKKNQRKIKTLLKTLWNLLVGALSPVNHRGKHCEKKKRTSKTEDSTPLQLHHISFPWEFFFFDQLSLRSTGESRLHLSNSRAGRLKTGWNRRGGRAIFLVPVPSERGWGSLRPHDAGEHWSEPLLVLLHRQVHDALSAELDGGGDVWGADLPVTQSFKHPQELVDRLLGRALHLEQKPTSV